MNDPQDGVIRISADTSAFDAAMRDISQSAERFGSSFSRSMREAAISGRDLDDTLRGLALRLADLALEKAFAPLDQLAGNLFQSLASAGLSSQSGSSQASAIARQNITFNVQASSPSAFAKSQGQISAMLARAVKSGSRSM
ncbi:MAG: hypothetical protein KDJ66_12685 [Nitratireductor sp.]|nr:hypothetical protein [Nitratireductor sp.]